MVLSYYVFSEFVSTNPKEKFFFWPEKNRLSVKFILDTRSGKSYLILITNTQVN